MEKEKILLEIDKQEDKLVEMMNNTSLSGVDVLELIEYFVSRYLWILSKTIDEDTDKVVDTFIASVRENVSMIKMGEEVNAGGNVDTIVNKYFRHISSDIRKDFIRYVRMKSGNDLLSSIALDDDE